MQVPALSIVFMCVSALISIGVPILLFFYFRKKFGAKVMPMLFGLAGFTLFAMILESGVHNIVFRAINIREMPALYIVYGIFMAGIFEESARFIAFNILKKRYSGIGTALSYGIGHGGIEAILLAGISMISAIVTSILINTGNIEAIIGNLQGDALTATSAQLSAIILTPPSMFLVSGIERLSAIVVQLSLSVIVFYAVYGSKKIWLYPLAIVLHAIIDIPAAAMQVGVLKSIALVEVLVFVCAIAVALLAKFIHDKLKVKETVQPE